MSRTLQECKDEIAKRYGYPTWDEVYFYQIDALNETGPDEDGAEKFMLNQAVELYAESAVREYRERQWIAVSERLPEAGLKVLLMTKFGRFAFGRLNYTYTKGSTYWSACSDGGYSMNNDQCKAEITHWQELPSPPNK